MSKPYPSHFRQSSVGPGFGLSNSQQQHSPALVARINEKKIELEQLKQLRDLSGNLARDLHTLEEKLKTLSNGTEAVAAVLANWHNILRAISMASSTSSTPKEDVGHEDSVDDDMLGADGSKDNGLPQMLVRVPTNITNS